MTLTSTQLPDPRDTIAALSSATGSGGRAILRLSGPQAFPIAAALAGIASCFNPATRFHREATLRLPGLHSPLAVALSLWPGPHTLTGQDLVEIHMLAAPPLVELLLAELFKAGARAAQPGEFTMRAFLAGKLDLPRAEAVLGVIEANSRDELKQALEQLAGGVSGPLREVREDLLNLLADVEAALDFADEDIQFVEEGTLLTRITKALALLTNLRRRLEQRAVSGRVVRVVLAGRPNAGKSSLFNALSLSSTALVSPEPGTTRDYLTRRLMIDEVILDLVDTAGWHPAKGTIESQAQDLRHEQMEQADLILLCLEAGHEPTAEERTWALRTEPPAVLCVATKCDLAPPGEGLLATSARAGSGLDVLRQKLAEGVRAHRPSALAPSLSRCRGHLDSCLEHLRQAHQTALFQNPPELLALALRESLEELGAVAGAVYTDDLLDRIFSRFCIGK